MINDYIQKAKAKKDGAHPFQLLEPATILRQRGERFLKSGEESTLPMSNGNYTDNDDGGHREPATEELFGKQAGPQ